MATPIKARISAAVAIKQSLTTRRVRLAICGVAIVIVGLGVHYFGHGAWAPIAGGALYAGLIYVLVSLVAPRLSVDRLAASTLIICVLIELAQLTPVPLRLAELWSPSRLVLGTTFDVVDLFAYAIGAVVAGGVDAQVRNLTKRSDSN